MPFQFIVAGLPLARRISFISASLAIILTLAFAVSAEGATTQTVRGNVPAAVKSLSPTGHLAASNRLNLAISLPLRNQTALSNFLQQLYNPTSTNYRHYLTPAQFTERFGPTAADYAAVIAFAKAKGFQITATHSNRLVLDVAGAASMIEGALNIRLNTYRHPKENRTFFAPDIEPSVSLAVPVLRISGLDNYSLPHPRLRTARLASTQQAVANAGSGPSGSYLGSDFRAAYVPRTALDGTGQSVGLLQFDGYSAADIAYYENQAGLPHVPLQNVLIDGASGTPSLNGGEIEVSLDIEMAISMATNLSKVIVYEAPNPSPWVDLLSRMANDNLAKQLSSSWYDPGVGADPAADQIFQQMAAQGQTFFNASGDSDAYTGLIDFPGDSPYITQVGGTTLTTGTGGAWASETVWNWGPEYNIDGTGSGGGISTQYPIPTWQTNINMSANQGSASKRNIPDVAMTADNVYVRADGYDYVEGGTSCAAPLWAGFAALVNQQANAAGHAAIGFINPALDQIGSGANYSSAFHDITTGNNTWSGSPNKFYAVSGFDLCTGWGTPRGQGLINALASPEPLVIAPALGFAAVGGVGGPFTVSSEIFGLTNIGTSALTWSLSNTSTWLNISSTGGTLNAGAAATVTVSLNSVASNLLAGTYSATLWFTNVSDGNRQGRIFTLSVIDPPIITRQPTNESVLEGAAATFTVSATGGQPLAYQWRLNATNLMDGGGIVGTTTTNLTIANVSANNVGNYTVVVTNVAGTAMSSNAVLSLIPSAPVIIQQPTNCVVVSGATASFSVAANGSKPFNCQWSFNNTSLDGATNAILTLVNVQSANAGNYSVAVSNSYGTAFSSNAILTVVNVPVITAINPISGNVGATVTITGANFDPVPANNTVYFGAVKAVVLAATWTNLIVTVPSGATYAPVTETVNGLTAYSSQIFLPEFLSGQTLGTSSFTGPANVTAGDGPARVVIGDLDGDGKPDVVAANVYDGSIWVYRNISTNGVLSAASFAAPVILTIGGGSDSEYGLALADLNGDGKLDLVTANRNLNIVSIFQNLSTPGSLTTNSFGTRVDIPVAGTPSGVVVADLDGDGKPDVVTVNQSSNTVSILRNLGGGIITTNSFATAVNYAVGGSSMWVAVGDLDGDGKTDIVTANNSSATVSVLRNLSTMENIAFATHVDFAGLGSGSSVVIGDLNGDGKPDLIVGSQPSGQAVEVYQNTSTVGVITNTSFAAPVDLSVGGWANTVAVGDLDGDGKPDVIVAVQLPNRISLFRNVGATGTITSSSFDARIDLASGSNPNGIAIGDLDGDGRADFIFGNTYGGTVSVYQNITPFSGPPYINVPPTNQTVALGGSARFDVVAGGSLPLSYQWYYNTNNLISGATNATLILNNVQDSNGGGYSVIITNMFGSVTSQVAVLTIVDPPTIATQPVSQTNLAGTTAVFSVVANGTAPFSYRWLKDGLTMTDGGNVSGSTAATLTLVNVSLTDMAGYSVIVANMAGSVTSIVASLTVLAAPSITLQPLSYTNYAGMTATFTVAASGSAPLNYQWYFNTSNIILGGTNATLTLTNMQLSQTGTYAVLVTNAYGSVWSSNALLVVNPLPTNIPVIFGFSPRSTVVGASVTIVGTNFDSNPSNNTVYFGAVKAVVLAATWTNLVVTVPSGATYAPVTETVNGLTAYSSQMFLPEFLSAGTLGASSFTGPANVTAGNGPARVVIGDLDGDGKPDVVAANVYDGSIWIYRNISTNGVLASSSFAAPVILTIGGGGDSEYGLALADLNGDGKLDLVTANRNLNIVSIFQNLSTPGSLTSNSFGTRVDIPVAGTPSGVAVADMDGDGKPDVVTVNQSSNTVSILRNLGGVTITTNSFAAPMNYAVAGSSMWVAVGDLDGDGKADIVTANNSSATVSVLQNLSTMGNIAFATHVDFAGLGSGSSVVIGDLNGDGKPDLIVGSQPNGQAVEVYQNTSTVGIITNTSFAAPVNLSVGGWANTVAVGDLDGDGKPDVIVAVQLPNRISLFRNVGATGTITSSSFDTRIDLASGSNPNGIAIGDLDGDGRPDFVFGNTYSGNISVDRNTIPVQVAPVIILQPANQTTAVGGAVTFSVTLGGATPFSYRWYFNQTNLIAGATNSLLALTNVQFAQSGYYSVVVTNAYGMATSSNALLTAQSPPILLAVPTNLTVNAGSTATFMVSATGSLPLAYQWSVNGTNNPIAGATNAMLVLTNVSLANAGNNYAVMVLNPFGSTVTSNATLTVVDVLDHFVWNTLTSPRFVNTPLDVVIEAIDPGGQLFTNFNGIISVSTTNGVQVNPTVSGNFTQGIWNGRIFLPQAVTNLVLQASDGNGHIGLANPINILNLPSVAMAQSSGTLLLFWPDDPAGFGLEVSTNLMQWKPVTAPPLHVGNQYLETLPASAINQFYRLHYTAP